MLRRERYIGRVGRSFALEHEVDEASASARYQDGVLELVLPKKQRPRPSVWPCSKPAVSGSKGGRAPPFLLA